MSKFKISIDRIKDGVYRYNIADKPGSINFPVELSSDIKSEIILDKKGNNLLFKIHAETVIKVSCDRCLDDFYLPLQGETDILFTHSKTAYEDISGEASRHFHSASNEIDFGQDIRDILVLEIPMKILCSENCRGFCPGCGVNLNYESCKCATEYADPWKEELKKILKKLT